MSSQRLQAESLPLTGRHIIEASAGTGKTFTITRLYLRLLLERELKVQEILVVTFTRAATEELRGRIAKVLRETLSLWGQRSTSDTFFQHLESCISKDKADILLHEALLDLDEASIFTIHGFCSRVLSQQAFTSGLPFQLNMEANTSELQLEVVRDAYRKWALDASLYPVIAQQWPLPENFLNTFGKFIQTQRVLDCPRPESIEQAFIADKRKVNQQFSSCLEAYKQAIVNKHKDKDLRNIELDVLMQWLALESIEPFPESASGVLNGRRFGSAKAQLKPMTEPLKRLKEELQRLPVKLATATTYRLAISKIPAMRNQLETMKSQRGLLDFDDLIRQLNQALQHDGEAQLKRQLLKRYPVALVDEFQDTDPDQYAIFDQIFSASDNAGLFMIGDPKQAIYSFRGGDVFAYLHARNNTPSRWFMDTNWRSTSAMVQGYNRLFYGEALQKEGEMTNPPSQKVFGFGIEYAPVKASDRIQTGEKVSDRQAIQWVHFSEAQPNKPFFSQIARWCAQEITRLLKDETETALQVEAKPIQEKDIAILVRKADEAAYIREALQEAGYNAVYSSDRSNVMLSTAADQLYRALNGILHLEDARKMVTALSTNLFGLDEAELYALREDEMKWEHWREILSNLRIEWHSKGFMVMALHLLHDYMPHLSHDRERVLTNYLHLVECLQEATRRHKQPLELLAWFENERQIENNQQHYELRLESDENLIRIITQHGSKGLEYPVVFIPFSAWPRSNKTNMIVNYHDANYTSRYCILPSDEQWIRATQETEAEDKRLLYVAVTRAIHRCYICSSNFNRVEQSPLGLTLGIENKETLLSHLQRLQGEMPNAIGLLDILPNDSVPDTSLLSDESRGKGLVITNKGVGAAQIQARKFTGKIDRDWWISSFTSLSYLAKLYVLDQGRSMALPDRDQDEGESLKIPMERAPISHDEQLPLRFRLKKGTDTGLFLHNLFEHMDFTQPDWHGLLNAPTPGYHLEPDEFEPLKEWLLECLQAPLAKEKLEGLSLSALMTHKTLKEVEFYFPMKALSIGSLADHLRQYRKQRNPASSPFWLPAMNKIKGMMHGFIDLVFEWQGRYYVVDYKSNGLGNQFTDYDFDALQQDVETHFYDLQYLIYSVALHRQLKAYLPDYRPQAHFGGVFYLYLRGMHPKLETGIFHTLLSADQLLEWDSLFGGVQDD
jgi:exodeoxyribonuclease V beta subunit